MCLLVYTASSLIYSSQWQHQVFALQLEEAAKLEVKRQQVRENVAAMARAADAAAARREAAAQAAAEARQAAKAAGHQAAADAPAEEGAAKADDDAEQDHEGGAGVC